MNKRIISVIAALLFISLRLCGGDTAFKCGFENSDAKGRPLNWLPLEQGMALEETQNNFRVTADEALEGKSSGRIKLVTAPRAFSAKFVEGLKPNTWHCASVWMKTKLDFCNGGGPALFVGVRGADTRRIGDATDKMLGMYKTGCPSPEWFQMKLAFKTPENPNEKIYVGLGGYDLKGKVFFDKLAIEEITPDAAKSIKEKYVSKSAAKDNKIVLPGHIVAVNAAENKELTGRNLIMNGSFEAVTSPDMPDCWAHHLRYSAFDPNFRENYKIITENPFHGKKCFRLNGSSFNYGQPGLLAKNDKPGVLSLSLRSNDDKSEITVISNNVKRTFKPGKEWKRYEIKLPKVTKNYVRFETKGFIFIDAVKLELGNKATTFTPNAYESVNPVKIQPAPALPETSLSSGKLEIKELKLESGASPSKKTECVLIKNKDSLTLKFKCRGRKAPELIASAKTEDDIVEADDSVSLLVNPAYQNGSNAPFIFTVNCNGIKSERKGSDRSWNALWSAEAKKTPNGYDAAMNIPFACLGNGNFWSDSWMINLVRNSAANANEKREVSAWNYCPLESAYETGYLARGFDVSKIFKFSMGKPKAALSKAGTEYTPEEYSVILELAFPENGNRNGRAEIIWPDGGKRFAAWKTKNGKAVASFKIGGKRDVESLKDYTVKIIEGGIVTKSRIFNDRLQCSEALKVGPCDRNYYSKEQIGRIKVETNITKELADRSEIEISVYGPMERVFDKRYPAASALLEFPVKNLPPGLYRVAAKLVKGPGNPQVIARGESVVTKLKPGKIESKYDPIKRIPIINNKPFVIFSISLPLNGILKKAEFSMGHYRRDINEMAKRFNTATPYIYSLPKGGFTAENIKSYKKFFNEMSNAGLKLDIWLAYGIAGSKKGFALFYESPETIFKNEAKEADLLKNMPGIIAWSTMDEVYGHWNKGKHKEESEVLDFYWKFKKEVDPYRLYIVNSNYCGRVYGSFECADVVGGSYYTIKGYPPGSGPAGVAGYIKNLERERKKKDVNNVTGGFLPFWADGFQRNPSVAEARCSIYVMLVNGARLLRHYEYKPLSMALWDSFAQNKKEVEFLAPILYGKNVTKKVKATNKNINFSAFECGSKTYLIAVNCTYIPDKCAFDLTALGHLTKIKDCFEKREVRISDGIIVDEFKANERHVYEIR